MSNCSVFFVNNRFMAMSRQPLFQFSLFNLYWSLGKRSFSILNLYRSLGEHSFSLLNFQFSISMSAIMASAILTLTYPHGWNV